MTALNVKCYLKDLIIVYHFDCFNTHIFAMKKKQFSSFLRSTGRTFASFFSQPGNKSSCNTLPELHADAQ